MIYEWCIRKFSLRYADLFRAWQVAKSAPPEVTMRVRELMAIYDEKPQTGEWKRHQVYARLLKEFPTLPKGTIGLLIEATKCSL